MYLYIYKNELTYIYWHELIKAVAEIFLLIYIYIYIYR